MVVAKNIKVDYGSKNIFNKMSFHIKSGDCVGIAGLNGAGKTTLINCILGKKQVTSGLLMTMGSENIIDNKRTLRKISVVSGTYSLISDDLDIISSFDNCAAINKIGKKEYKTRLKELIKALYLEECLYKNPKAISLGQRKRADIAYALINNPKLLILDEATVGLDIAYRKIVLDYLKNLNQIYGTTIIFSSNYLNEIIDLCKSIIVIHNRSIIYDGNIIDLINKKSEICTLTFSVSSIPNFEDLPIEKFTFENSVLTVFYSKVKINAIEIIKHICQNNFGTIIKTGEPTLEDTIKSIYANRS